VGGLRSNYLYVIEGEGKISREQALRAVQRIFIASCQPGEMLGQDLSKASRQAVLPLL
jgi:hypothetical protein